MDDKLSYIACLESDAGYIISTNIAVGRTIARANDLESLARLVAHSCERADFEKGGEVLVDTGQRFRKMDPDELQRWKPILGKALSPGPVSYLPIDVGFDLRAHHGMATQLPEGQNVHVTYAVEAETREFYGPRKEALRLMCAAGYRLVEPGPAPSPHTASVESTGGLTEVTWAWEGRKPDPRNKANPVHFEDGTVAWQLTRDGELTGFWQRRRWQAGRHSGVHRDKYFKTGTFEICDCTPGHVEILRDVLDDGFSVDPFDQKEREK